MVTTSLSFRLNDEEITLSQLNPNTTVLQYLREHLAHVGSKEGCASGDCGACTVVISELVDEKIRYRSVNACITLLISLHGKQLITVEALKQKNGLHPVQQSLVDCHGSQCGFCTPGFVMSLFALHKEHTAPSRQQVTEALSGNLCRCTGYRSIIDAGLTSSEETDSFQVELPKTIKHLKNLQNSSVATLKHDKSRAYHPRNIQQLTDLLDKHPNARLVAGGTDLCLELTQDLNHFDILISTLGVRELSTVKESDNTITIGAAASYTSFIRLLAQHYPHWGEMIERLGSMQIRNLGTLGGNIANASPVGDMTPVLIALEASVILRCGSAAREMAVEDFFLDYKKTAMRPSEFIESIRIPKPQNQQSLKIYKVSKRFDDDISAVLAVFNIVFSGDTVSRVGIAYGGMAATPRRAANCEAALRHQTWNETSIQHAMQVLEKDFTPLTDARASSDYRMQIAKNLLRRAFIETTAPAVLTQVFNHA